MFNIYLQPLAPQTVEQRRRINKNDFRNLFPDVYKIFDIMTKKVRKFSLLIETCEDIISNMKSKHIRIFKNGILRRKLYMFVIEIGFEHWCVI